jgi:PAS domain S-box-containing protein
VSRPDEAWSAAEQAELARLNTELATLAQGATDAQALLGELAAALFPDGPPSLKQLTWPDKPASRPPTRPEDRLRAAEARYRSLVEQIPAVTFMAVLGEGANEVYVSPHIEALLGFTQQEWLENPFLWYAQLHPDDRALWNDEFARGCRTGGPFHAECRFLARDGRVVWVRGDARVVLDDAGRPLFLQGVAFDITESKRAERLVLREAVRTTEERYRDLVEGLGAVVWEANPALFDFTLVSRHAEELLGFSPDRWVEDREFWPGRIHPDDLDEVIGAWRTALQAGDDQTSEYRVVAADGRVVWLQDNMRVLRDAHGRAQHLLGVMLDVTNRKHAEEERRQLLVREREARAESETLNRVERLLAAELDFERLVQTVTDAGTELCGARFGAFFYNVKDAAGESYMLYSLSGVPRDAFAGFAQPRNTPLFDSTFRGAGIVRSDDVLQDPRYGTMAPHHGLPAGHLPVRSYLAVPVVSRSGEVLGGLFFGHPEPGRFTERHERMLGGLAAQAAVAMDNARLFEAAERSRHDAETANRAKDEFLATMSHELRTPLTAVLGWTRMLRTGSLDPATRARALETIERNAQAQVQLVEDILDVSRIVTGKLQLVVQPVDLGDVVRAAHDVVRFAAQAKGVTLELSLDPDVGPIMGDGQRLQQVMWNLLSNAIKFTSSGGRVLIRLERMESTARIIVRDTGAGISADFLPHVFDRFRQADGSSTRRHGGLGLGLAIVRHITEQHGGTVRAESAGPEQGATFIVEIPINFVPVACQEGAEVPVPAQPLRGMTVLVVDDEIDARDLIAMILRGAGAQVVTAPSADAALDMIARTHPAVLISDIGMPGNDGYALLAELRRLGIAIPALAVTAYGRDEDRRHALRAGFRLHIPKPIDAALLIDAVSALREPSQPVSAPGPGASSAA